MATLSGTERTLLEVAGHRPAKVRAAAHRGAEELAGGDVRDAQTRGQDLRLRALAGAGCADHDEDHRMKPS